MQYLISSQAIYYYFTFTFSVHHSYNHFSSGFAEREMLSSLKSHDKGSEDDRRHRHHRNLPTTFIASPAHSRQLLLACADLVNQGDTAAARRALAFLSAAASPHGECNDRVVHHFARALDSQNSHHYTPFESVQSSHLSFNKITPFLRFCHLTANQAILEAVEGRRRVHVLDFDTLHGLQWAPLLQAIAERSDPEDPTFVRITGTGDDPEVLRRTGERLETFARSLGLNFRFSPLVLPSADGFSPTRVEVCAGETLAVNCVLFLHKLLVEGNSSRTARGSKIECFLQAVRSMGPAVVTVAEREARHNSPAFLRRFVEALDYYTAVFESLEATLPPSSRERLSVEHFWLGQEIGNVVGTMQRHEQFERWEALMRASGFTQVSVSSFALSQAKLLLRLHYPTEGYQLQMMREAIFLGWHSRPLFSVSSWC